jgi:hypothetical protein
MHSSHKHGAHNVARLSVLIIAVLVLSGCSGMVTTTPQTREEFKKEIMDSPKIGLRESYTSSRRFDDVVRSLEQKWNECYNTASTTHASKGGMTTMHYTDINHPRWQKINNSLVEFTLQRTTQGMTMINKVPPGGEYIVALNVERLPNNKAKLTWYSYTLFGSNRDSWDHNKKWSDGQNAACE